MDTGYQLSADLLFDILEHLYNEVYVLDRNMNVIYVNEASCKHYGLFPEEMIGRNHMEFVGRQWYPSVVPQVYETKKPLSVEQVTCTGERIVSTATPVLDQQGEVEMVVCVTEEPVQQFDVKYFDEGETQSQEHTALQPEHPKSQQKQKTAEPVKLLANGRAIKEIFKTADQCAACEITVLIQGESGTGKSLLAQYIHEKSERCKGPFVEVNCATIPENLLEFELFGCAPHAFTGAPPGGATGLLDAADGGTLFLDEIGEMPLALQAKLLHVLETMRFIPVGGKKERRVDVRIITATNQNLQEMIRAGTFREDLFWRIHVMSLFMPPLRERSDELHGLICHFLDEHNQRYQTRKRLSPEAESAMLYYSWPGNIRQLKNTIERLVITVRADLIQEQDLPYEIRKGSETEVQRYDLDAYRDVCARKIVAQAWTPGMTSRELSQKLSVSQATAARLIRKYILREE